MRVIGIDPSPAKGLATFDGKDRPFRIDQVHEFVAGLEQEDDILLCWDAPLTGPSRRALGGDGIGHRSDFTQRRIESFFSRTVTGFSTPDGISVSGYAACQHWTLSRSLLGLPRVGTWDRDFEELPFRLAHEDDRRPRSGRWIVEVHPAVAAWLWCLEAPPPKSWKYKEDDAVLRSMWREIVRQTGDVLSDLKEPTNDDEFDARVAYALGRLWLEGGGAVVLLGDLENGTFLLPDVAGLSEAFQDFIG